MTPETVHRFLQDAENLESEIKNKKIEKKSSVVRTPNLFIKPKGIGQAKYVERIRQHDVNFGVGPAGTGKTFLAVACAVEALEKSQVERIIIARPAVEAGERLGFLPGDLSQKVDPFLRPIYDALYEMLGVESTNKLIERNIVEIAPLAFMRGRTLNNAFMLLDESQNTTPAQMKMFLTRIGFNSRAVITGDNTQTDLPELSVSGLEQAVEVLGQISDISFTFFTSNEIVRNGIVRKVVDAYEKYE